jgi:hypothetical protein
MDKLMGAFKSKTVWFGLAVAVLSWAQSVLGSSGLSPEQVGPIGTIIGAAIVWLRAVTSVPLEHK